MKVLFATYPMAFHTPGGGEIQLLAYRDQLLALGVEVALFDLWDPQFLAHDVVHFFSCVGGSSHFCAFVKQLGLPLVVSASLWITKETMRLYPVEEVRLQLELADRIICNSDLECDRLAQVLSLDRGKFTTVYNGVNDAFFAPPDPAAAREAFGEGYVLSVGNIEPRKNQLGLVRAMKAVPERRLVLIGHARDPAYAETVRAEGGAQLIDVGPLPHYSALLRSAYAGCSAFVLPSTLETPGLAALEAGAQGAPLVVTCEGSAGEYFGDGAIYVDPNSIKSIRDGVIRALSAPPPRPDLGRFRWSAVCGALPEIYLAAAAAGA